jgi:hypothetical protein
MKKREFNSILRTLTGKSGLILAEKAYALPVETKTLLANYIIRHRGPLLAAFVTPATDRSWLASMGYLHETDSKESGLKFMHTSEHKIK